MTSICANCVTARRRMPDALKSHDQVTAHERETVQRIITDDGHGWTMTPREAQRWLDRLDAQRAKIAAGVCHQHAQEAHT